MSTNTKFYSEKLILELMFKRKSAFMSCISHLVAAAKKANKS